LFYRLSEEKHIGFTLQTKDVGYFDDITREDLLEFGCSHEFVGRFSLIINFHALGTEVIVGIIEKARLHISYKLNTPLELSERLKDNLIESASGEFGCRLIYATILELSMKAYSQILKTRTPEGPTQIIRLDIGGFSLINATEDYFVEKLRQKEQEDDIEKRSDTRYLCS